MSETFPVRDSSVGKSPISALGEDGHSPHPSAEMSAEALSQSADRPAEGAPDSEGLDRLKNRMLGEFRLLHRLGRGGMAEVYLAEQTSLKRRVAVKILQADSISDSNDLHRFEQEAKAAAILNHPNIVQVYLIGEQDGIHYIVQEYVPGWNLREFLNRKGLPTVPDALQIMMQVASALQSAGEAGIVHRDIKPENILISRKGEVKVTDFGLARLAHVGDRVNLTQVGMTMGTPLYMSPEQVNGKDVDQRSDLYSFGVTCYHLLAGKPPFHGQTALSVAVQHLNSEPDALANRRSDLPPALCTLVHKMMAKEPNQRYSDAQTVLRKLQQISKTLKQAPRTDGLLVPLAGEAAVSSAGWGLLHRLSVRRWKQFVSPPLIAYIFVALSAAGIGWWLRPPNPLDVPPRRDRMLSTKRDSAAEQFSQAMLLVDNEEAWEAVIQHYGNSVLEANAARLQLALMYLRERRFAEAERIFRQFESQGEQDLALKANGLAGLAVLASLRGDHDESQRLIVPHEKLLRQHLSSAMRPYIMNAIRINTEALGQQAQQSLIDLFETGGPDQESTNGR